MNASPTRPSQFLRAYAWLATFLLAVSIFWGLAQWFSAAQAKSQYKAFTRLCVLQMVRAPRSQVEKLLGESKSNVGEDGYHHVEAAISDVWTVQVSYDEQNRVKAITLDGKDLAGYYDEVFDDPEGEGLGSN